MKRILQISWDRCSNLDGAILLLKLSHKTPNILIYHCIPNQKLQRQKLSELQGSFGSVLLIYLATQKTKIIFFKCEENLRIRSSGIYTPSALGWSLSLQCTRSPTLSLLKLTTPCFLRLTSFFPTFPDKTHTDETHTVYLQWYPQVFFRPQFFKYNLIWFKQPYVKGMPYVM